MAAVNPNEKRSMWFYIDVYLRRCMPCVSTGLDAVHQDGARVQRRVRAAARPEFQGIARRHSIQLQDSGVLGRIAIIMRALGQ